LKASGLRFSRSEYSTIPRFAATSGPWGSKSESEWSAAGSAATLRSDVTWRYPASTNPCGSTVTAACW